MCEPVKVLPVVPETCSFCGVPFGSTLDGNTDPVFEAGDWICSDCSSEISGRKALARQAVAEAEEDETLRALAAHHQGRETVPDLGIANR